MATAAWAMATTFPMVLVPVMVTATRTATMMATVREDVMVTTRTEAAAIARE